MSSPISQDEWFAELEARLGFQLQNRQREILWLRAGIDGKVIKEPEVAEILDFENAARRIADVVSRSVLAHVESRKVHIHYSSQTLLQDIVEKLTLLAI